MITLEQARQREGSKVVYRAPHVRADEPGEEGVITSVGHLYVFVRFGFDLYSKATPPEQLDFVTKG